MSRPSIYVGRVFLKYAPRAHCLNIRSSTAGSSWYQEVLQGTLFSEDKRWLQKQSGGIVNSKTVRRYYGAHRGNTLLKVKCTTDDCAKLNDMIQLALNLITENGDDKTKKIVLQRLQQEGRTSWLKIEGDASGKVDPYTYIGREPVAREVVAATCGPPESVGTACTTMPPSPPPPAGAAAAAGPIAPLRRAPSRTLPARSQHVAEADGSATAAALPAAAPPAPPSKLQLLQLLHATHKEVFRSLRASTQSRPAPHEATPPAPHEADGSATAAAPPRGRHEEEEKEAKKKIPRQLIMHDTTANAPSPRAPGMYDGGVYCAVQPESIQEKKREQRWEEQFKLLKQEYIFKDPGASESATNAEQSRGRERSKERLLFSSREGSRRGRGRGKKRELSTPSSEADDSATAAAKLERAASSEPPSAAVTAAPATPVGDTQPEGWSPVTPINPELQDEAATLVPLRRLQESPVTPIDVDHDLTDDASSEELERKPEAEQRPNPDIARYVKVRKEMPLSPGHDAAPAPGCAPTTSTAPGLDSPAAVRTPSPALQESRQATAEAAEQADVDTDGATPPGLIPAEAAEIDMCMGTPTEVPSPPDLDTAVPSPRGSVEQNSTVLNSRADQEPEQIPAPPGLAVPLTLAHATPAPAFLPFKNVELNFNLGKMETDPCFAHSHHDDLSALQRRTTSQIHIQSFPTQPGMRYLRKTLTVDRCRQN